MEIDDKKQKSLGNGSNEPSDMTEKSEIKTVSNSQKGVTEIDQPDVYTGKALKQAATESYP